MAWFEKLETVFKVNVDLSKKIEIKIVNRPENKEKIKVGENGEVSINYPSLSPEEGTTVSSIIKDVFASSEVEKVDVLEDKSEKRIEDIKQKLELKSNFDIIHYYKDKLLPYYLEILEAALYVRTVHQNRGSVVQLKEEINRKYGEVGRNITNFCTAGYFENFIKDIYERMSEAPNFTIERFHSFFINIAKTSPFAIFVHSEMDLEPLIKGKISMAKRYGIKFLDIHGIGKDNVSKMYNVLTEMKGIEITASKMEDNVMYVRIAL